MESVIIILPRECEQAFRARIEGCLPSQLHSGSRFVIEEAAARVYVSRDDALKDDFEARELERIVESVADPVFYAVDFSDISLCRRVLATIANDARLLVHNDHEVFVNGSEFVRILNTHPGWDWRVVSGVPQT